MSFGGVVVATATRTLLLQIAAPAQVCRLTALIFSAQEVSLSKQNMAE